MIENNVEKGLNGDGSIIGMPMIQFDPKTTPQVEEAKMNKYGLDITNPDFIIYKKENLEAEIIGGINTQVLNRFTVLLKISKRPQQSVSDVYRNNVDLYNDNNVQHYTKQAQIKLKIDATRITDFIYDLTERLESYRKDKLTYVQEAFPIESPQPKTLKRVHGLLTSEHLMEELKQVIGATGFACPRVGLQLFIIALSSKLPNVMHGVLQGSPEVTTNLIHGFSKLLPTEVNRFKTSISDSVLYYAPTKTYWTNKVLLLPTIDTLGKKNTALTELISQGELNRLVTENTEQGTYRASNKHVNGNLSFISSTSRGYHELLQSDNVIGLPLASNKAIKEAMVINEIKRHAGLIDFDSIENATKLMHFIFRELKPVMVVNPFLDQLDVATYFDKDYKLVKQFLQITNLITLLHQKQLGVTKNGDSIQVEVQPSYMLLTLELFRELWVKEEKELSFNHARTLSRIKATIKSEYPENYKETEFKVKELRAKLKVSPSSFSRHINTLYDYGKLERTGGNRKDGYNYKVTSWDDSTTTERFEQFKKEVSQL